MIARILAFWTDRIKQASGNFLAYDCETTGLSKELDLIWQIGRCAVSSDGLQKPVAQCLNWYASPAVNPFWLNGKIEEHSKKMAELGKPTGCSVARIRAGGRPERILQDYVELFDAVQNSGGLIVGHNIVRCDNAWFSNNVKRCTQNAYRFRDDCLLDTAAIVKAAQIGRMPDKSESIGAFCRRILSRTYAPGIYFSLDRFCVPYFKLVEIYGIDTSRMHGAGYDAFVTQLLLQEILKAGGLHAYARN